MPIEIKSPIKVFNQEEYHALNRRVMRIVFDVQNEFGRFLDEDLAKAEIAARSMEAGITPVEREVRIRVTHEQFAKDYFMDLLLAGGVMFEVKTSDSLAPAHRAQSLNYLLLSGMRHGTLVNLRPARVEHEFISTRLTPDLRQQILVSDAGWVEANSESALLKRKMVEILRDWGAFLEVSLYREALTFFLGGAATVLRPVEVLSGERSLGTQTMHLIAPDTAFAVSAATEAPEQFAAHLSQFLHHTRLARLQWINLNHHVIEFRTIPNQR